MAQFQPRLDIWELNPEQRAALQPGQHISAGGANGVYLGQTKAGSDVALWEGNTKGRNRVKYMAELRDYAKRNAA